MAPAAAEGVVIERAVTGQPHAGKVLAAIQPHADDIPLFAAGTTAKLIAEGYTAYMIRITNDDMTGRGTVGDGVRDNEADNQEVAKVFGCRQVFDLNYNNHRLDQISPVELRARLIFLIRLLKIDTVICYDPWGPYEENPDHYVTARAVESACWMAGMGKDYAEHMAAGLRPHSVREKYYFARGPQLVNRVVDITSTVERKIDVLCANKAQGPAGDSGARLRASLAAQNLRLPPYSAMTTVPRIGSTFASSCSATMPRWGAAMAWVRGKVSLHRGGGDDGSERLREEKCGAVGVRGRGRRRRQGERKIMRRFRAKR